MLHQHHKRERGSSLLESALVYGAFLFILIATIDFGYVLFMYQTMAERSRMAVRYGIARPFTTDLVSEMKNMVLYSSTTAPRNSGGGIFGLRGENIQVTRVLSTGPGVPDQLTVQINAVPFRMLTPLIAGERRSKSVVVSAPMENP